MAKDKKEISQRKARLLGALSGLAASESSILPGIVGTPMGMASEIGTASYHPEVLSGLPVWMLDPELRWKMYKMRKYLGVERMPVIVGPMTGVISPQTLELAERYPWLFGDTSGVFPHIEMASSNLPAAAHELGHASRSPIHALGLISKHPLLRALGISGGVLAGLSDNETMQRIAPAISGAAYAPELLEEARASIHGTRALANVEGTAAALKGMARLLPALGSYAVHVGPAIAAPYIARAVKEHIIANEKQGSDINAMGRMKLTSHGAWGTKTVVKPQTTKPTTGSKPDIKPQPKPPGKGKFLRDITTSIQNPQRGERYV